MYLCSCRNESTGNWRGIRLTDGKLQAPGVDGTWSESIVFCVVYPKGHTVTAAASSAHQDSQHSDNIKGVMSPSVTLLRVLQSI